jgi:pantoate--beta-alanine ligase
MRTVRSVAEVRGHIARARAAGRTIGLVPTMGAFHDGHLSLIRGARELCDEVVVSLFVNPTQFNDPGDLAAYPRSEQEDAAQAAECGADLLFAPHALYADGHATTVAVSGITGTLEGEQRGASHFDGVCTVVTKLFNIVGPDLAFFGQKDAQQVAVIRRMVRDLDIPVTIEVLPTVREPDGLAMSSRNVHLSPADRPRAVALREALAAAEDAVRGGERDAAAVRAAGLAAMRAHDVEPEYLELVDPDDLSPVPHLDRPALVAVAARVGSTRLIDNLLIEPPLAGSST